MNTCASGISYSLSGSGTAAGLAELLHDQQRRWRAGQRPGVEDYLARYPRQAAVPDCVLQLLLGEFLLRRECGETPSIEDYRQRFPDHAEALYREIQQIGSFLAEPLPAVSEASTAHEAESNCVPTTRLPAAGPGRTRPTPGLERGAVPGYEVYEVLGKGGMGIVYRARQLGLDRVVALKMILHAEHASAEARQRFQREAQAIARLQQAHIVQIHEVGQAGGLPYFSLEYCAGGSLEKKLDGTPWEARPAAELVHTLAGAVAAAHAAGIVHRDLKPGNVLLAADGTPKVTDFGLAKRLNATGPTVEGAILGTPSYMAPEQADGKGREAGPAADVYALGAILYELLTGRPPFRAATALDTLLQVVNQEPVAVRRLQPKVPKDLETICHKCLEKDPKKRYPAAAALAEDLRRFGAGEPVTARPVGRSGRLWRWVRRKPALAGLVTVVLLALAGLVVGAGLFALQAEQGRRQERKRLGQIEKANDILLSVFRDLDPTAEEKEGLPLRAQLGQRLDRAADLLQGEAVAEPLAVARLQLVLGEAQRHLGFADRAIALESKACQTMETYLGPNDSVTLESINALATSYSEAGQLDKSIPMLEQTLEKCQAILGPDHPDTLQTMGNLANAYVMAGQFAKAVPISKQLLQQSEAILGPDHLTTLKSMGSLAIAYQGAGELDKAVALHEKVLEKRKAILGPDHADTLDSMTNLANAHGLAGHMDKALLLHEQALQMYRTKLGPDHPGTLTSMNNLAVACWATGKLDRAVPLYEQALEKSKIKLGPEHPSTLSTMNNLAAAYFSAGQLDKALPLFQETLQITKAKLGPNHPDTLQGMANLAEAYQAAGQLDKARPLAEQTLELRKAKLGPDHPDTLLSMKNVAGAYGCAGALDRAVPLLQEALLKHQTKLGPDHPQTLSTMNDLATTLQSAKQPQRALAMWRDLLAIQSRKLPADHIDRAGTLAGLGRCLLQVHKPAEAEPLLREALAIRQQQQADAWETFHTQSLLGGSLLELKKYAAAEPLLLAGYEGMEQRQAKIYFSDKIYLKEALERVVQLYEATDKKDQADKWRQKRAATTGVERP
jgi:tetratricopeptide (TPR) repeat protein